MKNNMKKTLITLVILAVVLMFNPPAKSYALNVIPVDMNLYAISGTPVYAVPDVYSGVVVVLDREQFVVLGCSIVCKRLKAESSANSSHCEVVDVQTADKRLYGRQSLEDGITAHCDGPIDVVCCIRA